jgi:sugar phosphate isomerase/epimerase
MANALGDDARQAMSIARTMGFSGIVFDAHSPSLDLTSLSITGRREFAHLLRSNAQTLAGIRADIGPKGFSKGADIDRLISGLDQVLHVARDLVAGAVLIDTGPMPEVVEAEAPKPKITPEQAGLILIPSAAEIAANAEAPPAAATRRPPDPAFVAQVDAALSALCAIADRYQVTVAIRSSLAGFASLDRAIKTSRCPWLAMDLDPIAALHDRWSIDELFSRAGNSIAHVLARDGIRGESGRVKAMPVGSGEVEWNELLAALDAAGYRGWITFEPVDLADRAGALRAGIARLNPSPPP